ncbi:methylated-DNA--[protein]-cysteine S-methyltransferase [Roseibium algae]|uniref:Methylated-DNA--protein-cysteine methyltransferase n=1 Tax=Roseibium algae TaxID=3123038 RepID=A0ABU8THN3_9HYPH
MPSISIKSPVGNLTICESEGKVRSLDWQDVSENIGTSSESNVLQEAAHQLNAYFAGTLKTFDLPLAPKGSEFHQSVYSAMSAIPYGNTRTYGDIAKDLKSYGQPVGQACGANPIPIIIPCHRVLSAQGLGGFSGSGGVQTKIALLKLEGGYPFLV